MGQGRGHCRTAPRTHKAPTPNLEAFEVGRWTFDVGRSSWPNYSAFLSVPDGDIAATTGQTLGGVEIKNDGSWNGKWIMLPTNELGILAVKVPAASAAIIKFAR